MCVVLFTVSRTSSPSFQIPLIEFKSLVIRRRGETRLYFWNRFRVRDQNNFHHREIMLGTAGWTSSIQSVELASNTQQTHIATTSTSYFYNLLGHDLHDILVQHRTRTITIITVEETEENNRLCRWVGSWVDYLRFIVFVFLFVARRFTISGLLRTVDRVGWKWVRIYLLWVCGVCAG